MAGFEGVWHLESSENFDDFMKALGVGFMTRKVGASVKPVVTIARNGDNVSIKSESTFKTVETTFQFDKEFDETTADDRKVKSVVTQNSPTKWTHIQKGSPDSTYIRELVDNNTLKMSYYPPYQKNVDAVLQCCNRYQSLQETCVNHAVNETNILYVHDNVKCVWNVVNADIRR